MISNLNKNLTEFLFRKNIDINFMNIIA